MYYQKNDNFNKDAFKSQTVFTDTINDLKFSNIPQALYLASGDFSGDVNIFNIIKEQVMYGRSKSTASLSATIKLQDPILSVNWVGNSASLLASGCSGTAYSIDLQTCTPTPIAKHSSGCSSINYDQNSGLCFTSGWDGVIKVVDMRQANPLAEYNTGFKVFKMDCTSPLLVAAGSDKKVCYFNLNLIQNGFQPVTSFFSNLKFQIRSLRTYLFNNQVGYLIGSIEGRAHVKNVPLNKPPNIDQNGFMTEASFFNQRRFSI